jgi:hypothetical protein
MKMGPKIADVSTEDRARIAVLHKLIKDLEGQIAVTIGSYTDMDEPKVVTMPDSEAKKHADKDVCIQVASTAGGLQRASYVIYMDPPGICTQ